MIVICFSAADEDFNSTATVVNIGPDDTLIKIYVPIFDDAISEKVEMFLVMMAPLSQFVSVEDSVAIVQILDQDGMSICAVYREILNLN